MRNIRTKIEDIDPGCFYYATHYPEGYKPGTTYVAEDVVKFDLIIYVTGTKPFLSFDAWEFKNGRVTRNFCITDLWVGPRLMGI